MSQRINRRDLIGMLGASGLAAGVGAAGAADRASAAPAGKATGSAATMLDGKVVQPERELPVLHETEVLVVGGGSAGVAAAIAARRTGAKVTLMERYGHFGGQWTGGLVLMLPDLYSKDNPDRLQCQGIGEEMLQRLDKMDHGVIDRRRGKNPVVDGEATKYVMVQMIDEAGVDVFLHSWCVDAQSRKYCL